MSAGRHALASAVEPGHGHLWGSTMMVTTQQDILMIQHPSSLGNSFTLYQRFYKHVCAQFSSGMTTNLSTNPEET
jgi:hypothetical protein